MGIWAGILAIFHTFIGLTAHLRGRMWMYFLKRIHPIKLQNNQFGFANYAGLGAASHFFMLLAISNDASLRTLKTSRWKSLQRGTYAAFVLTAAHGIAYQSVEKRHTPWVLIFSGTVTAVLVVQTLGFCQANWGEPKRRAMGIGS